MPDTDSRFDPYLLLAHINKDKTASGPSKEEVNDAIKAASPGLATQPLTVMSTALQAASSLNLLMQMHPNVKAVVDSLFNWSVPEGGQPKATKAVMKAVGQALQAKDEKGSQYALAVEAIVFAAVASPLVEPDHIVRLIEHCMASPRAYAPPRHIASMVEHLKFALTPFAVPHRVSLLESLWDTAHEDRWWDTDTLNGGDNAPRVPHGVRESREELLADPSLANILQWVLEGKIFLHPAIQETLRTAKFSGPDLLLLRSYIKEGRFNAEADSVLSNVRDLKPADRAESPTSALSETTFLTLGEDAEAFATLVGEKPTVWSELCPKGSLARFKTPPVVARVHNRPELLSATKCGSLVVCRNEHELSINAKHMGNCTLSYLNLCITGANTIIRFEFEGTEYNAAVLVGANGGVTFGEINSRFNRGGVPTAVRTALTQLFK